MFLGIDCSTQSFKVQIINESRAIEAEVVVVYDRDLPHYKTVNGIIRHIDHGFEHISTPTLLFIDAFELALSKLKENFDLSKVKAISGSGQQHGSVWWKVGSDDLLKQMDDLSPDVKLTDHFQTAFSKPLSPIWMDASTTIECQEITECTGQAQKLADITGSRAYERFTGPQIKHLYKHYPEVYANTERISLISSFLPSLLSGRYFPIDLSDGSGMNILDIKSHSWDSQIVQSIAPNLNEKLGQVALVDEKFAHISQYWSKKYGFSTECQIHIFSGDNPCSLVGLGLNKPGDIGISLGTSDVLFAVTANPKPSAKEGSIFVHPEDAKSYMMLICYKNGAPTRNFVKDSVNANDPKWNEFNKSIAQTPVGNGGKIAFYYNETEITPNITKPGIVKYDNNDCMVEDNTIQASDCRGIIESQALSFKYHATCLGLNEINSITVTGGGSVNKEIVQIIADVFGRDVMVCAENPNTACTGAALMAMNRFYRSKNLETPPAAISEHQTNTVIKSNEANSLVYRELYERYVRLEKSTADFLNSKF